MSRRIIRGNDVAIATRAFDDWAHPPALLIMRGHGTHAMVAREILPPGLGTRPLCHSLWLSWRAY
ncbi:hypothetical protein [Sinorhizobium meliloti]|uniref:hypothetical protein n=1 Tax=Rhizobium meliloti TaxID=382 RepID=UPI0005196D7F|nr:hypothetical protein [Sinorhizobium meliloti]